MGCRIITEHEGAAAFGKAYPEFWIQTPFDGAKASLGNGVHVGFMAQSKTEVNAFFKEAIAAGAKEDGDPGHRHDYGEPYYVCFVRDLDGNKIEAAIWDSNWRQNLEWLEDQRPRKAIHTPPAVRQMPLTISMARMRERESHWPALPASSA